MGLRKLAGRHQMGVRQTCFGLAADLRGAGVRHFVGCGQPQMHDIVVGLYRPVHDAAAITMAIVVAIEVGAGVISSCEQPVVDLVVGPVDSKSPPYLK